MPTLTLEAIELVDAIDRHGSFAAAAERLGKVPSTISYAVAKLETQLGYPLFIRKGPAIALSPAGKALLESGRPLLDEAAELESRLRQVALGFEAEFRLAHDSLIPSDALLDDIRAFEALKCGTRLRLDAETLTGTWEALREDRADLVIAAGDGPAGGGYRAVAVGNLSFAFCVAPDHPLARHRGPIGPEELARHVAIVVGDGARSLSARTVGVSEGQHRITVPTMAAKIACQVAGLGHGFLPRVCIARELASGALVERPVQAPRPDETFWLAWKPDRTGEARKWWLRRLRRRLIPDLLEAGRSGGRLQAAQ